MSDVAHQPSGNCFEHAFKCKKCGIGNFCDVCHEHENPRGACDECDGCPACDESEDPHLLFI